MWQRHLCVREGCLRNSIVRDRRPTAPTSLPCADYTLLREPRALFQEFFEESDNPIHYFVSCGCLEPFSHATTVPFGITIAVAGPRPLQPGASSSNGRAWFQASFARTPFFRCSLSYSCLCDQPDLGTIVHRVGFVRLWTQASTLIYDAFVHTYGWAMVLRRVDSNLRFIPW